MLQTFFRMIAALSHILEAIQLNISNLLKLHLIAHKREYFEVTANFQRFGDIIRNLKKQIYILYQLESVIGANVLCE